MPVSKIGRNDPCPCGSGRKYKHCCLRRGVPQMVQRRNQMPLDDFDGLSPEQMSGLLHAPFDSPGLLEFAPVLEVEPEAPITGLFGQLCEALDAGRLKATAKGNLPRAFCQHAYASLHHASPFAMDALDGKINKEEDFHALHVTRLVAQEAGLLRKYKGHFILSRKCQALREKAGLRAIYPQLFQAGVRRFNWAYSDGYPDLPFIQQAFAFSLYLLNRYGDTPRSRHFYEDAFVRAFPMLAEQVGPDHWSSGDEIVKSCFALRTLERFALFMGLLTVSTSGNAFVGSDYSVCKTPLLDALVRFHLPGHQA